MKQPAAQGVAQIISCQADIHKLRVVEGFKADNLSAVSDDPKQPGQALRQGFRM